MNVEENFVSISGLICEPRRAKMLWNLLDGRAYTATELAVTADISPTSASNHLAKLLEANIVKVEIQGRHRYYSFTNEEVAYVVESLANLADKRSVNKARTENVLSGVKYCRTCYDHLAGFVAVKFVDALEERGFSSKVEKTYEISEDGWDWFAQLEIFPHTFTNKRRPITRQCLDWSERRPHLAGQLGAVFLEKTLQERWFTKVQFSRELELTAKGHQKFQEFLGITL